jgi:hypothetical protein
MMCERREPIGLEKEETAGGVSRLRVLERAGKDFQGGWPRIFLIQLILGIY